ncbi:MAG: cysteine--tRNA ligase [Thermodesulfobacteriota bacterium]
MTLQISNTMSGRKEPLVPAAGSHVRMYVCGITAYDYCHIGHARSTLVFDMIYRYLLHKGYQVTYVRNFTDIDDKIIRRAQEQGTTCQELAGRFMAAFTEDMERLGVAKPTLEPRATEHLPEMIALIATLVQRGLAYQAGGDVYFAVDRFPSYGHLAGRELAHMQAGARVEVNDAKRHPMDFVLWKASKPGEPVWDSPWGRGRPGWHIECSAMSRKYLGDTFEVHGGGKDLIFPHHENEIAQSEGASGQPFVRIWIHHGFVTIKDEKMSKSLGNFLTIREVLEHHHPEALRLFVLSTHYRNPLDYSEAALGQAAASLDRLYDCLREGASLPAGAGNGTGVALPEEHDKLARLPALFDEAMDDDFNSARALGFLFDTVKTVNRIRQALGRKAAAADVALVVEGTAQIRRLANVLGLLREDPDAYFALREEKALAALGLARAAVDALVRERSEARATRDWARADAIRERLQALRIEVLDRPDGSSWRLRPQ